jgi:phosphoribosylformylglycinamidine cyclo-ligase
MVRGFDLVGMAIGRVALDRVIEGQDLRAGDVVIGLESSGVHSNGLSLARRAFFESHSFSYEHKFDDLGRTIGEELLEPTIIYVPEVLDILAQVPDVRALVNITSDGFLNLARVRARVGFELTDLPQPQPIFGLIQRYGDVSDAEMHEVYNMGIGFCVVVAPASADATLRVLKAHGRKANVIGHVVDDPEKRVSIPGRRLVGQRKTFTEQR